MGEGKNAQEVGNMTETVTDERRNGTGDRREGDENRRLEEKYAWLSPGMERRSGIDDRRIGPEDRRIDGENE
jgi:hypothetical protein